MKYIDRNNFSCSRYRCCIVYHLHERVREGGGGRQGDRVIRNIGDGIPYTQVYAALKGAVFDL